MGHSFLSQIAQKIVETYIVHNIPQPAIVTQPLPIEAPLAPIEAPLDARIFISLPVTPPNERVTEIAFNQAAALQGINQRIGHPDSNRVEDVETIYARYLTEFPLLPELPSRSPSPEGEQWAQSLEDVPITPPSAPISPNPSETFDVVDLSP